MIEQILRKGERVFRYGEVAAVNTADEKVQVRIGSVGAVWIKTQLLLDVGDAVIVARSNDAAWFIVQDSRKAMPSEKLLLSV